LEKRQGLRLSVKPMGRKPREEEDEETVLGNKPRD